MTNMPMSAIMVHYVQIYQHDMKFQVIKYVRHELAVKKRLFSRHSEVV